MKKIINSLVKPFGNQNESGKIILQEEPLSDLPQENLHEETMPRGKREMIHKILAFSETVVSSIMTPRSAMFTLSSDLDMAELLREVKKNHFSRIPVYKQEKNTFIGILYAKDLLSLPRNKQMISEIGESLLRPPYFVPHDKKIPDLLKEFQDKQIHLALVVNENGTVNGLVTMEDLLEELFGEIYDEFDH
jgi:putative hemolysin